MVMGPTHAMSGAAAWLSLSAAGTAAVSMTSTPLPVVLLGAAVCAGAALGPDADSQSSTFVNAFGIPGRAIHEVVNGVSLAVYNLTRTKYDPPRENGHRTLTHTSGFAIFMGLIVSAASIIPGTTTLFDKTFANGQLASLLIMAAFLHLALAGLIEKKTKKARKKYGPYVLMAVSLALTVVLASFLPENDTYGWLGGAVAVGFFVHCLGDMITKMGVPLLVPVKIKGKRWFDVTLPSFMRVRAGGAFEYAFILPACTLVTGLMLAFHVPGVRPVLIDFFSGVF